MSRKRKKDRPRPEDQKPVEERQSRSRVPWFRIGLGVLAILLVVVLAIRYWPQKPGAIENVLLITLDTTRADHLGCYGNAKVQTPNLDRLAREGVLFSRAVSASPLTFPSHSAILTSLYPYATGARHNGSDRLAPANETLTEVLKARGYATAATVAAFVINREFGLAQGFDVYHDVITKTAGNALEAERYGDDIAADAIRLIGEMKDKRFFAWLHFYDPHHPYRSNKGYSKESREAYSEEIAFMDAQIGRVLDELERLGLEDRTLIVAVGDHGEGLGDHGEAWHGYFIYDSTLRVPLIVHAPAGFLQGRRVEDQVRTIDVAPTILDLVGAPALKAAQGRSLKALMLGQSDQNPRSAYSESLEAYAQFKMSMLRSLSVGGWKYLHAPSPELYDTRSDPGEKINLAAPKPGQVERLRNEIKRLLKEAPRPPETDGGVPVLSMDQIEKLQALGYTAGGTEKMPDDNLPEIDRFEPKGLNPMDHAEDLVLRTKSRLAIEKGRFDEAEAILRQLDRNLPGNTHVLMDIAHVLRIEGKMDEALVYGQRAVDLLPDDAYVLGIWGEILSDAGRLDQAIEAFRKVLAQLPDQIVTLYNLGIAFASKGDVDEAVKTFHAALVIEPRNTKVLHALAVAYARKGDLSQAETYLKKALDLDPSCGKCRMDLEMVERAMGQRPNSMEK